MQLKVEEERLLEVLREVKWGEVVVKVKNGLPVMVSKTRQDIKLSDQHNNTRTEDRRGM